MQFVVEFFEVPLLFNWRLVAIALLSGASLVVSVVALTKHRLQAAAFFAVLVIPLASTFAANSVLAPASVWQTMYAAYKATAPNELSSRKEDISEKWLVFHEEILLLDWYRISGRWGICHELWKQTGCVAAPTAREPMGIARELLTQIARDAWRSALVAKPAKPAPTRFVRSNER